MKLPSTVAPHLRALACFTILMVVAESRTFGVSLIFSDDMSAVGGWQYSHGGGTAKPDPAGNGDATQADFGFDYAALGIPEAPHSNVGPGETPTSGLRLAANLTGQFDGEGVAAVYEDGSFTGQYTVKVDMWLNWAATGGSNLGSTTEHGGLYVGFDIDQAQSFGAPRAQNGAGLTLDTDGGSGCGRCDYVLNKNAAELDTFSGQYAVMSYLTGTPPVLSGNRTGFNHDAVSDGPMPGSLIDLPNMFPSFDIAIATDGMNASGTQPAGAAGFQWITITAEVDTNAPGDGDNGSVGTAKFSIENNETGERVVIGTVDNSVDDLDDNIDTGEQPVEMEGAIGLTWIDFFLGQPIPAQHGFGLFDNVRVFDGFLPDDDSDLDDDADFDGKDFLEIQRTDPSLIPDWETNYGNGVGPVAGIAAVPEPATALLIALGAMFAVAAGRR